MKRCLCLFLLLTCVMMLPAQVTLVIKELKVYHTITGHDDQMDVEGDTEGPFVVLKCCIINQDNKDICFTPSTSEVEFLFNYREKDYSVNAYDLAFVIKENEVIKTNEKLEFDLGHTLLLGTPLCDLKRLDYSMILLEVLPTLRVHYKDKNLNIFSSRIESVRIF